MRTPVIVVTGIESQAMSATLVGLAWDLPRAVVVRHWIDPDRQVLTRSVSDSEGVLEHEEIALEHACVSCALREDIVPTIERVARDGRWASVVACLPVAAEAGQFDTVVAGDERLQRHLRISTILSVVSGETAVDDLLGDDLLAERDRHTGPDDRRGLGEVGCALVEYADVVVVAGAPDATTVDLVHALARPTAEVVVGAENVDAAALVRGSHEHAVTTAWAAPALAEAVPEWMSPRVWRLELASSRAFHPDRLLRDIGRLGSGRHRSRGTFWLPSRPGQIQVWDGSGGQLSIGSAGLAGRTPPTTRLLLTGVGVEPAGLREAFEDLLVVPGEELLAAVRRTGEDGLEPWLGAIRESA
jgi:G3E family GTPase